MIGHPHAGRSELALQRVGWVERNASGAKPIICRILENRWVSRRYALLYPSYALEPFSRINPCGYPGLQVTQLRELGIFAGSQEVQAVLLRILSRRLGYTTLQTASTLPPLSSLETGHA